RITTVTDPLSRSVGFTYDSQGHLMTVTDPASGVTSYTYDASHRLVSITDPRTIPYLTNEYDAQGRVSRQTQADGGVFAFTYAVEGQNITATTVTDPRGNATTHRFNSAGFPLSTTDALGQTTRLEYTTDTNLLLATTDPLGRVTRFTYDALGNVTTVTDPAGTKREFTYEPNSNRITKITTSQGATQLVPSTDFAYDGDGNLTTITDPLRKSTTLTYNTAGQPLTIADPLGHTTVFTYDGQGNLATVADPLGNTTRFEYDAISRRIRQVDPRGRPTSFTYDGLNRVRTITDALGGITSFTYDGNGNLLTLTDARANPPTSYTYDSMDRVASRTDPLGGSESFVYDLAGNLTRRTDRKSQISTFNYDALNRLTTASYADGSGMSYRYDGGGRLMQVDDSTGGTLTSSYDVLDRVLSQSTTLGTISYAHDALGRRTQLSVPGVAPTTYGYDDNSRLRQIVRGTQTVGMDYDDAGRRTLLTLLNGVTGVSTQYQYDEASRLTALVYQNAAGPLGNLTYQYDAAGNRVRVGGSFARTLLPSAVASATYDGANRQLAFGASQMTYDANGNLTTITGVSPTTSLTWDARDRLIGLEQAGTAASFVYAFGRRNAKTVNGAATQFLYDGLDLAQQVEAQRTTNYLRALSIDETLGFTNPDGTFFLTTDALGSTVAASDGAGNVVDEYTYDPFGAATATNPAFANAFQFTGRENDGLAGLYYYRARYYNPVSQRFSTEDSLECERRRGMNLYAYVRNNPVNLTDPLGLAAVGPDGCSYYDAGCVTASKTQDKDGYLCRAGDCCRQFGSSKEANAVRGCLIEWDHSCATLPQPNRRNCRLIAHGECYARYRFIPEITVGIVYYCGLTALGF
ncbi:MAG TPA: RHS repeat-associated core domain-containing protein, partial [Gemmatimonadales bacterium]|nr:RHS repeat-associated core domain-containing protein [Gemmatimonadales bacterium]